MAERNTTVEFLRTLELFSQACDEDLLAFAANTKRHTYRRGEVVFHQDDPAGHLFILIKGFANVTAESADGRVVTLAWLRAGSLFGTTSVLDGRPQPLTVTAGAACEALVVDSMDLKDYLLRHPEAALVLLRSVAARWRSVMEQLQDMAFLDINGRLAKVLLNLASPAAPPLPDRVAAIAGHVSQSQLASLIGASRESVNKALQAFAHQNVIELREGRVRVLDVDKLHSYANGQARS